MPTIELRAVRRPLTRIHSILKHSVSMPDSDIDLIVSVVDGILSDLSKQPQLNPCAPPDVDSPPPTMPATR